MGKNQVKRTVKQKFLIADNVGKIVKGVGGNVGVLIAGAMLKTALDAKNEKGDS